MDTNKDRVEPKNKHHADKNHRDEIEGLHTKIEDPFEKLMKLRRQLEEMD